MNILALDTTSADGSVAIRSGGRTVAAVSLHSPDGFSPVIYTAIESLKNKANLPLEAFDCFAAAAGPGSLTGVRVGLSVVKSLAESTGKRALGVSNLRLLSSFGKTSGLRAVALDARRSEVYAAVYDRHLRLVGEEAVLPLEAWLDALDLALDYEFIFPARFPYTSGLGTSRYAGMAIVEAPAALAEAAAICAERDGTEGLWLDPAALDANYVRRSDAELFWKDR